MSGGQYGPFVSFLIARTRDKLHLCTYTDPGFHGQGGSGPGNFKTQQQRILMRMNIPSGGGYMSFDHKDLIYYAFVDEGTDLTILIVASNLLWSSRSAAQLESLACTVLSGVFSEFLTFAPVEEIATASRPFQFIKFEPLLLKSVKRSVGDVKGPTKTTTTSGSGPGGQYDLLKKEIQGVQHVIKQNLEDILTRGERLETMTTHASQLREHSAQYQKRTTKMNRMRLLKMYGPPAAVIIFVVFYLCVRWL